MACARRIRWRCLRFSWKRWKRGFNKFFICYFWLDPKVTKRSRPKTMACRTASLSGEPQGGECLRAEGKRSAKAPRPALRLNPLSSALWPALPRFLASAHAPSPVKCVLLWRSVRYVIAREARTLQLLQLDKRQVFKLL